MTKKTKTKQNKQTKINETKSWYFVNINKMIKLQPGYQEKKGENLNTYNYKLSKGCCK